MEIHNESDQVRFSAATLAAIGRCLEFLATDPTLNVPADINRHAHNFPAISRVIFAQEGTADVDECWVLVTLYGEIRFRWCQDTQEPWQHYGSVNVDATGEAARCS